MEKKNTKTINNLMGALASLDMARFNLIYIVQLIKDKAEEIDTTNLHKLVLSLMEEINKIMKGKINEKQESDKTKNI